MGATDRGVAVSNENTLRKACAHMRWQVEKCGVDAESCAIAIVVADETAKAKIISGFLRDFDPTSMRRENDHPERIIVHGIRVGVYVKGKD